MTAFNRHWQKYRQRYDHFQGQLRITMSCFDRRSPFWFFSRSTFTLYGDKIYVLAVAAILYVCRGCAIFRPEANRVIGKLRNSLRALQPRYRLLEMSAEAKCNSNGLRSDARRWRYGKFAVFPLSARHGLSRATELPRREYQSGYVREDRHHLPSSHWEITPPARSQQKRQIFRRHWILSRIFYFLLTRTFRE